VLFRQSNGANCPTIAASVEERRNVLDKMDLLFGNELSEVYHKYNLSKSSEAIFQGI